MLGKIVCYEPKFDAVVPQKVNTDHRAVNNLSLLDTNLVHNS